MNVNLIVSDLDGPLLDVANRHFECYRNILNEAGFLALDKGAYWRHKRDGLPSASILAMTNAESLSPNYKKLWMSRIESRRYLAMDEVQAGVRRVLQLLRKSGVELVLSTMRNNRENLIWQLAENNIGQYFSEILPVGTQGGAQAKASSVSPWVLKFGLKKSVWVGDTEADIEAARSLQIKVIALTCGIRDEKFLRALEPDTIKTDLTAARTWLMESYE